MIDNASGLQSQIANLNEADGPVFKIYNDPRYTPFGEWLSHTGLDELPQLMNIFRGEMDFVGPRPLPIDETKQIPNKYITRFSVLPGITSSWVIKGSHKLTFEEWMELDLHYINSKSITNDLIIAVQTISLMVKQFFNNAH